MVNSKNLIFSVNKCDKFLIMFYSKAVLKFVARIGMPYHATVDLNEGSGNPPRYSPQVSIDVKVSKMAVVVKY